MKQIKLIIGLVLITSAGFSQQIKISALPTATKLNGTEQFPIVQGGVTKKVTIDSIYAGAKKYTITKNATRDTIILSDGSNITKIKDSVGVPQGLASVTAIDSVTTRKVTVGKFRITDLQEFENNTQAIDAGLEVGDEYRLPYNDGAYRIAIVILQNITMGFTVTAGESVEFSIADNNIQDRTIDWGDGVIQINYPGPPYSHTYTNAGTYNVKFIVNNISGINVINVNIGNLIYFLHPYLPSLTFLKVSSLSLSTEQVNTILIQMNNYGYAGALQTDGQTPSAPPSGAGITAKNAIIARGGTVSTD